ncbi:MAG: ABC transporter ATP-binding protein, partial [Planctomycetes bacterium]|nr:ABC transporter ATP-binding protein [Planctomycetota bacterium]
NGSGKSTLMKILVGLVRPVEGIGEVFGEPAGPGAWRSRARIGYLPPEPRTYPRWTGGQFLDFSLSFHPRADRRRAREWAARLELPLGARTKTYSTGMKQRLALLGAACCGADLLILDEPTGGMDPSMRLGLFMLLQQERAAGRSVLLSSHLLGDLGRLCDGFLFLKGGRPVDLSAAGEPCARVVFADPEAASRLAFPPGTDVKRLDGAIEVRGVPWEALMRSLAGFEVQSLEYRGDSLEDRYRAVYGGEVA